MSKRFETLVAHALAEPFTGWDFTYVHGRIEIDPEPWDYRARVETLAGTARSLCDLGTGGGEFLASLSVRPPLTFATEAWLPNVPVAGARLGPLGVGVIAVEGAADNAVQTPQDGEGRLPLRSASIDVLINRHEAFLPAEVARVLSAGGTFLTQQVGGANESELNDALGAGPPETAPSLEQYVAQLQGAGLVVRDAQEAHSRKRYLDVGAIAFNIKAIPWQFPGFELDRDVERLRPIHRLIEQHGAFEVRHHRLLLEATKD